MKIIFVFLFVSICGLKSYGQISSFSSLEKMLNVSESSVKSTLSGYGYKHVVTRNIPDENFSDSVKVVSYHSPDPNDSEANLYIDVYFLKNKCIRVNWLTSELYFLSIFSQVEKSDYKFDEAMGKELQDIMQKDVAFFKNLATLNTVILTRQNKKLYSVILNNGLYY